MCKPILDHEELSHPHVNQESHTVLRGDQKTSNTSPDLDYSEIMSDYSNAMMLSGYNAKFRTDILSGVIKRWKEVKKMVEDGSRKLHRSQEEIRMSKANKPGRHPATWFLSGETTSTLTVPITPNSCLKTNLQSQLKTVRGPDGGKTKVVEESGSVIAKMFPSVEARNCPYQTKCLADEGTDCLTQGVIYQATCQDCPEDNPDIPYRYLGMSGQSIHAHTMSHIKSIKGSEKSSSLYKHNLHKHSDSTNNFNRFKFTQLSSHKDNISRYLNEAYQIYNAPDKLMNSKSEYNASKWISVETRTIGT